MKQGCWDNQCPHRKGEKMNSLKHNDEGFTGLEAAIVLIAFVVVAAVDLGHDRTQLLEFAIVLGAEDLRKESIEHKVGKY